MLAQELEAARKRQQILDWDAGEKRLAEQLKLAIPKTELSDDIRERFGVFERWCGERQVRRLPAKPWTVAAFLLDQIDIGRNVQGCLALLAAIEAAHDCHSLSNPAATAIVRAALDQIVKIEPPRSWNKDEKAEWARLPPAIKETISRHENLRDKELRRLQNKVAEAVKQDGATVREEVKCLLENEMTQ